MLKIAKYIYHKTLVGKFVGDFVFNTHHNYRMYCVDETKFLKQNFKETFKFDLDLENPKTFNEKLQWLKLNDRTPLHTICADKFKVREFVKEKIGAQYLIPLVFHTKNPQDIVSENLPDYPIIIKTNHNSSGVIIIKDKSKVNWKKTQKTLTRFLKGNYYYRSKEWQYKNIEKRIVVEKLLMDEHGNIPYDFKLHFFNGKLGFTQVDIDRQIEHKRNLYDVDWNLLDVEWIYKQGNAVQKPKLYNEMVSLGAEFAKDFTYIRVDFYHVNNRIYFGELTFHSEGGRGVFTPNTWDLKFGELLKLNLTVKHNA